MTDKKQTAPGAGGESGTVNSEAAVLVSISNDTISDAQAQALPLAPNHLAMLRDESGISDDVVLARGYRTITAKTDLAELGFSQIQQRVPGLLLPLHTTDGNNSLNIYRPDSPRVRENKRKGKRPDGTYPCTVIKYETPKGSGTRVDCPPVCQPMLEDPSIPLWITEGQKKADALASQGLCAVALLGVWSWRGKNELGGLTILTDLDYIAFNGRDVRLVFDSDVMTKPAVRKALERFTAHLQRKKAHVATVYLPGGTNGKMGVDDWLAEGHTIEELEALIEAPRPEPKAAAPLVELLDAPPATIRRPLSLVDGRAYAATWLPVRVTVTEGLDKQGHIIKFDPPKVETRTQLFIIRNDGAIFGDLGGDKPLSDLGIEVILPEIPRPLQTWSTAGVKAYRAGERPKPADVFNRVADVVDRFLDFSRSLADQRSMTELVACYVLATWFLDAFNVIGYLWPNGDRGSGKTVLLLVVAQMAYLGQVILAGGSYATLRDLADYGATLAFDDAENLSDPRKTDPDKRTLLLAGNRRGAVVTLKEQGPDKTWVTRHVDAFCPRLFSAIRLPDNVLASRSIVIPLIRTPDRYRANADPLDYDTWPHDRRQLIDDLWALALAHLPALVEHDKAVSDKASLTGRNLEPWRAILAVASWLDAQGVTGLWEKMDGLTVSYQTERTDLEYGDFTSLIIRALCARCASLSNCANYRETPGNYVFEVTASDVKLEAVSIAENDDGSISPDKITSQRVGMSFRKMRFGKPPRPGGKGSRKWEVTLGDLERWTSTYGLTLPDELRELSDTLYKVGTVGEVGTVGTDNSDLREVEL